jgi:hypothetical protein
LADFTGRALQKQIIDSWKEYLSHDVETWRRDYFDRENGGYLVTARQRIERSTINKQERAKLRKELDMAMVYAKNAIRKQQSELVLFQFDIETDAIYKQLEILKRTGIKGLYFFIGRENNIFKI